MWTSHRLVSKHNATVCECLRLLGDSIQSNAAVIYAVLHQHHCVLRAWWGNCLAQILLIIVSDKSCPL